MAEEPVHRIEPDAELGLAPPPYQYPARHVLNGDFIHQSVILDQILSLLDRAYSAIARLSMDTGALEDQEDKDMTEVEQLCEQIPDDEPIEVNGEAEEDLPGPSTGRRSHPEQPDWERTRVRQGMRVRMMHAAMSRAETEAEAKASVAEASQQASSSQTRPVTGLSTGGHTDPISVANEDP